MNPKRELFQIEPEQAIALLELMADEDVTPELRREADAVDIEAKDASSKLKATRRPNLNFPEMGIPEMGIPIGSELQLNQSPHEAVTVMSERKVKFRGVETSLTAATREMLNIDYQVAPGPYWSYQGRSLRDIYNETYAMP